jgi:FtsH-binding integral membrane protein
MYVRVGGLGEGGVSKGFGMLCIFLGVGTIGLTLLNKDYMDLLRTQPVTTGALNALGGTHISLVVFGLPALLGFSGIRQVMNKRDGIPYFYGYSFFLGLVLLFSFLLQKADPQAFSLFSSNSILWTHIAFAIVGTFFYRTKREEK